MKVCLKGQREVPTMLQAGKEQIQKWESLACSRNRRKAGGAGPKEKLVGGKTGVDKSHQVMQAWKTWTEELRFYSERDRQL